VGPFQSKMESSNFLFNTKTSIWRTQLFFKTLAIKHRLVQNVLLLAATHKTFDVIKAKPNFVLYIVGGAELLIIPLYMGPRVLCLSVLTLALHKPPILYCIAQHLDKQQQKSCAPSEIYKYGGFDLIIAHLPEVCQFQTFHWHQIQFHHGMNKTLRILRRCLTS
jgi:hypothetical protein